MRPLSVALLSLAACGGVNTGKSLEHPATPEAALGLGFSSLAGKTRGDCVVPMRAAPRPGNNRLVETVFHARSKEEILREVGYSGGINFGFGGFGLNAGFESLDRKAQSASTSFAVVRIQVEARSETLKQFALKNHAAETLRRDGPGKFYEKCGDGFVAAIRQGGSFLGIVALEGVSSDDTRRLSGNAGVSFLGFGVSGGANNETRQFLERHRARYYIIQEGGDPSGATTLQSLENIDNLLKRAEQFKRAVGHGRSVATQLVIEPYQVTSNRPRRADLWNLTEQRRFLDQLAVDYGALQQADAELKEKLGSATCARKGDRKRLDGLHEEYEKSIRATRQRAEDCLDDPQRKCNSRRLDVVDPDKHRKLMGLCVAGPDDAPDVPTVVDLPPPPPKPGLDAPCNIWQFSTVSVEVSPSKSNGAPWDADGSPPETAFMLWLGERKIAFPTQQSYSTGGTIDDGLVSAGATVKASLIDRDAFFDDRIALISETVPPTLEEGVWKLESGRTSVSLQGRCVE